MTPSPQADLTRRDMKCGLPKNSGWILRDVLQSRFTVCDVFNKFFQHRISTGTCNFLFKTDSNQSAKLAPAGRKFLGICCTFQSCTMAWCFHPHSPDQLSRVLSSSRFVKVCKRVQRWRRWCPHPRLGFGKRWDTEQFPFFKMLSVPKRQMVSESELFLLSNHILKYKDRGDASN